MRSIGRLFANNQQKEIYSHNISHIRLLKVFQSLYFLIPVWVSFELKYITLAQLAMIEVVISASQLILELPTGALADLLGRKATIAIGYFIGAISYMVFAFCTNFNQFLVVGIFFGLFESLISGSEDALLFDTLKEAGREDEFAQINNKFQITFHWGMAFATLIGGLIYKYNFHLPGILNGLAFFVAGIITLTLIEPSIDSEKFTLKNYIQQTKKGFGELFKSKKAREISLFYILVGSLTWPIVIGLKNITLTSYGFSETAIGFILPIISLSSVYFLHFLLKKNVFENLRFTYLSLSILPVITLTLGGFMNKFLVIPVIWLASFCSSTRWNVLGKLSNSCYSSKNRATAISSLNMSISVMYVLVMWGFSLISENNSNSLRIVYSAMALLAMLILLPTGIRIANKFAKKKVKLDPSVEHKVADAIAEN